MTEFGSLKIVGGLLSCRPARPGVRRRPAGARHGRRRLTAWRRGESVRRQASRSWPYLLEVWQDFKRRVEGADGERDGRCPVRAGHPRAVAAHPAARTRLPPGRRRRRHRAGRQTFPVSHRAGHVPIHLLGWDIDLDHKTPRVTARAPQSMVQELLNRDDAYLWAILSNGAMLRLLRDSTTLVGSAYVEFDLEAMFDGELFADFVLLYLVCHESRFEADRRRRPRILLAGAVAHGRRRAGRARARPAPRRGQAGDLDPRHRLPLAPGQPAATRPGSTAERPRR